MRRVFKADELGGEKGRGLEIYVEGFKHDTATDEAGTIYIETYNNKLRILVWDGSGEEPAHTIEIDRA
jgi:hypothetical protein